MYERNRLGQMILEHWQKHRPQMVAELRKRTSWTRRSTKPRRRSGTCCTNWSQSRKWTTRRPGRSRCANGHYPPSADRPQSSLPRTLDDAARHTLPRFPNNRSPPHRRRQPRGKKLSPTSTPSAHSNSIEAENRDATDAEKAVLARYSGWGAMANVFEPHPPQEWEKTAERTARTPDCGRIRFRARLDSQRSFHLACGDSAVWQALERLGLAAGAQILEPSMGVGHFFGLMPEAFTPGARRTGVELDSLTARIAQRLYPDSTIFAKGFEETSLPDNFFDAVIGNIPFGNYPVFDPAYRRNPAVTRAIHDYFFAKSLDKARPGGMVALITSRYTMDKQDGTIRQLSRRTREPDRRHPASQHRFQGQRRHRSHDRYPVFLQKHGARRARERRGMAGACAHRDAGRADTRQRIFRASPGDDAGGDAARGHDVPGRRAGACRAKSSAGKSRQEPWRRCPQPSTSPGPQTPARAARHGAGGGHRARSRQGGSLCRARRRHSSSAAATVSNPPT